MSLQTRIADLITAIGADVKSLQTQINALGGGSGSGIETFTFSRPGTLTTSVGSARLYLTGNYTWVDCVGSVGGASAGSSVLVDVNKNGTTVFSTQTNRITIAAGTFMDLAGTPSVTTFASGDYITIDVDQAGSTPGTDLTVVLRLQRTA